MPARVCVERPVHCFDMLLTRQSLLVRWLLFNQNIIIACTSQSNLSTRIRTHVHASMHSHTMHFLANAHSCIHRALLCLCVCVRPFVRCVAHFRSCSQTEICFNWKLLHGCWACIRFLVSGLRFLNLSISINIVSLTVANCYWHDISIDCECACLAELGERPAMFTDVKRMGIYFLCVRWTSTFGHYHHPNWPLSRRKQYPLLLHFRSCPLAQYTFRLLRDNEKEVRTTYVCAALNVCRHSYHHNRFEWRIKRLKSTNRCVNIFPFACFESQLDFKLSILHINRHLDCDQCRVTFEQFHLSSNF